MASVDKIKIDGFREVYRYLSNDGFAVFVNKQSQFKVNQRYAYGCTDNKYVMSASQANEARTLEVTGHSDVFFSVNKIQEYLKINGFDLEEE